MTQANQATASRWQLPSWDTLSRPVKLVLLVAVLWGVLSLNDYYHGRADKRDADIRAQNAETLMKEAKAKAYLATHGSGDQPSVTRVEAPMAGCNGPEFVVTKGRQVAFKPGCQVVRFEGPVSSVSGSGVFQILIPDPAMADGYAVCGYRNDARKTVDSPSSCVGFINSRTVPLQVILADGAQLNVN